ncbi:MAG: Unknown protein [uncultured Thiotrichaceae bacterium]|uniref:UspA domain-containing protein n=1 Tax=uncultured Thiotrichaceae bacterium TaxID=298394 RepID=A0A6S6SB56_9GAMM|nr:MAG: Unknown protein [uncultured Thiotrichaceae bacterium]
MGYTMIQYFKNILVAIDFKETEQAEIDHAMNLAKLHSSKVTFMSVIPNLRSDAHLEISAMSPEERLELQLSKRLERLEGVAACVRDEGIEVECIATSGKTSSLEIIKQVIRGEHDLLMIAERDSGSLKNKLIGSTARQLLRKTPCPVWAVHPDHSGSYKHVMATIDVTNHEDINNQSLNEAIIADAVAIATADHSKLSVLSIPPNESQKPTQFATIKSCLVDNEIDIDDEHIILEIGDVATVITENTKKHDVDLLVMGMLSHSGIKGFFIGNTVEKVMDDVECSILTVKPKEFVSPVTLDD